MAIVSISLEEYAKLKEIEQNYNIMLKTWRPIPEKSLAKKAEKEAKMLEIQAQKEQKKLEKQQNKKYISSETLEQEEKEFKELKRICAQKANGYRLAKENAKRREEKIEVIVTDVLPNLIEFD